MAYFDCIVGGSGGGAVLTVTCSEDFAGLTITCSDGTTTLSKTCPASSPYTVDFDIPNGGTWTISGTIDGTSYSTSVEVTLDYTAELVSGFDWEAWATEGGVDPTDYSDLDDLLSDEEAVRRLFTVHASVDYLCEQPVDETIESIIDNDICAKWINLRDYALDSMYAVADIKDVMDEADKYGYGEWALMPQVPTMTSDTAPYGTAFADSVAHATNYPAYKAFDENDNSEWASGNSAFPHYIGYQFTSPVLITRVTFIPALDDASNIRTKNIKVQASNDNFSTVVDLYIGVAENNSDLHVIDFENDTEYSYYRLLILDKYSSVNNLGGVMSLQFYAYAPKGNVPVMTSNTAPYGEAICSSNYSGFPAYYAFDNNESTRWANATSGANSWIGYHFTNPVAVKKAVIMPIDANSYTATLQYSDDGLTWTNGSNAVVIPTDAKTTITGFTNNGHHLYWRMSLTSPSGTSNTAILQFYGRELSVSVPVMTSNTAPYGEVISDSQMSGYSAFKAFDRTNGTENRWVSNSGVLTAYCGFYFGRPIRVKYAKAYMAFTDSNNPSSATLELVGRNNDNESFTVLDTKNVTSLTWNLEFTPNSTTPYKQYAIREKATNGSYCSIEELQFYGLDYSEKEFEVGTTKKWLYDHGVELETMEVFITGSSTATKESDNIHYKTATGQAAYAYNSNSIDVTDYDLVRAKYEPMITTINNSYVAALDVASAKPTTTSWTSSIASKIGTAADKDSISIDLSSINQSVYIGLWMQSNNGYSEFKASELWLE